MSDSNGRKPLMNGFGHVPDDGKSGAKRTDFWNPTLNIRFVEGPCTAFFYAHIQWLNFYPSRGEIVLQFSTHTVRVYGRNLGKLYGELLELSRREIVVVLEKHDLEGPDAMVVHRVEVKEIRIARESHAAEKPQQPEE
jgi:hypothetical protein